MNGQPDFVRQLIAFFAGQRVAPEVDLRLGAVALEAGGLEDRLDVADEVDLRGRILEGRQQQQDGEQATGQ